MIMESRGHEILDAWWSDMHPLQNCLLVSWRRNSAYLARTAKVLVWTVQKPDVVRDLCSQAYSTACFNGWRWNKTLSFLSNKPSEAGRSLLFAMEVTKALRLWNGSQSLDWGRARAASQNRWVRPLFFKFCQLNWISGTRWYFSDVKYSFYVTSVCQFSVLIQNMLYELRSVFLVRGPLGRFDTWLMYWKFSH